MDTRGFSRSYAQEVIEAGLVRVNGRVVTKPGAFVDAVDVSTSAPAMPFVSRGGLKLAHALDFFEIELSGLVCLDVGSSTGGFTDCMLQAGATTVYAVDNGVGQMNERLRGDSRVVLIEGTDIRDLALKDLAQSQFHAPFAFATCDVSFISLTKVLPSLRPLIITGGELVCLIKPQFELSRQQLNKRGVVTSESHRRVALESVLSALSSAGFSKILHTPSPICGGDGNREYLAYAKALS